VLRIAKLGPGGESYYLQSVGIEPAGHWLGEGPKGAGLTGEVGPEQLSHLLAGRDPNSGEVLGSSRSQVRVTGFDLTFAAPKSVSILHGLSDQPVSDAVADGHRAAVTAAIDYVEERALGVRRHGGTERWVETVEGAYGAAFLHRTSRALDPHLHSHVVVANLGQGPDGRFSALDGRGIYAHLGAAGALYHAQLRYELSERLGVDWGPLVRGRADIAGITPEARRGFSVRSAEIAADLAASGLGGRRASDVAAAKTRQPKDLSMSADDLRPRWRQKAVELGLGPSRLEAVLGRGPTREHAREDGRNSQDIDHDSEPVVLRLVNAGRSVARRHVIQAWCMELPEGAPAHQVERVADSLLAQLTNERGREKPADRRDGPGVTERRIPLESLELDPLARRAADMAVEHRMSVQRQLSREPEQSFGRERGHAMGIGQSPGLGL